MRKKFGQNFLVNPNVRSRLLDALEPLSETHIWEIGPGLGAMTTGLLERGAAVTAFEIDPAFAGIMREFFGNREGFRLVEGDALETWPVIEAQEPSRGKPEPSENRFLFGNLPYNIAAVLLADFIEKGVFFSRMVVTVQREVAARMCAGPGSAAYSSFSVLCSSVYRVSPLMVIKGSAFYPVPRVDSQGVRLDFIAGRKKPPGLFYPLVRFLFSGRRKTLRNTLSAFMSQAIMKKPPVKTAAELLDRAGISGERRAETLAIEEFAALAASLEDPGSSG
jgi:16S rRNA (adenine1518-N6/adenine1519-N6)-dimethyltransferase